MKKFNPKNLFLTIFSILLLGSCSSSSDGDSSGNNTASLSNITLSTSSSSVILESQGYFTITVMGNDNVNYTNSSTIYVNGTAISGNTFSPTQIGVLEVYAQKDDLVSNTVIVNVISGIESVSVSVSESSVKINNLVEFMARDNFNVDVTSNSVFYVDGSPISGSSFSTDVYGNYEVYAVYNSVNGEIQSSSTNFNVYRFTKKVLVEDYTGTWCGYCPRLAYNLEQAEQQDDRVIAVGIHSGDIMETSYTNILENFYGINSWPNGRINRNTSWNESVNQILGFLDSNPGLGLALNSNVNGNQVTVQVRIGYDNPSSNNKLVIYLLEDGLIYPQVNYYNNDPNSPWYQTGNPIQNFEHNNVLVEAFTNVLGDAIPNANAGDEYSGNFSVTIPGNVQNNSNLEIVAFVLNTTTGSVINVQHAPLGVNHDFD